MTRAALRDLLSAPAPELMVCDELVPGTRPRKLAKALADVQGSSVALVGHQPDLGEWCAWLIGCRARSETASSPYWPARFFRPGSPPTRANG